MIDIWDRHAADADDVCFSVAAAALFCASYVSLPPAQEVNNADEKGRQHTLALLTVTAESLPFMAGIWLVQWLVVRILYPERTLLAPKH